MFYPNCSSVGFIVFCSMVYELFVGDLTSQHYGSHIERGIQCVLFFMYPFT